MSRILTLVHDDKGLDSRLQVAIDMARSLNRQLICLDLTIPIVTTGVDPWFDTMVLEPETRGAVQAAARQRVQASGISFQWVERRGALNRELLELADLADILVLSSSRDLLFPAMNGAVGKMLVAAQKMVVAVPTNANGMTVAGEAMLLWNGSEQAENAMVAALPVFRHATKVTILEVDDGSLGMSAIKAADCLSKCDVANVVRSISAGGETAGVRILEQIAQLRPAYVAMGGFGYPRLVEAIFGGVTERLLAECPVPLLLKN